MTFLGLCGSLLDSLLGALLQASVIDIRTQKIIEGEGGQKVPIHAAGSLHLKRSISFEQSLGLIDGDRAVQDMTGVRHRKPGAGERRMSQSEVETEGHAESRRIETGRDCLSNNGVNFVMAATMSAVGVVGTAIVWDIPLRTIFG